jgi:hypothetical protein
MKRMQKKTCGGGTKKSCQNRNYRTKNKPNLKGSWLKIRADRNRVEIATKFLAKVEFES